MSCCTPLSGEKGVPEPFDASTGSMNDSAGACVAAIVVWLLAVGAGAVRADPLHAMNKAANENITQIDFLFIVFLPMRVFSPYKRYQSNHSGPNL